jgi:hypothetical protein
MTKYHPIQQSPGMSPSGVHRWSLPELDTPTISTMAGIKQIFVLHERNPRTVTLFEVSNGTGWWDPAYRCLADRRHRHGAHQPVSQARPRSLVAKAEVPRSPKMGRVGSKVPVAVARAPPPRGLHLSAADIKVLSPPVPAAPRRQAPLKNCAPSKKGRRRMEKSPLPPSPPGFARQVL